MTLGAPRRLTERVVIPLEPGEEVAHLPPPSSLKLDLGDYRFEARAEGRQVVVERAITFDRDRVEPAAIADLRALVEAREAGGRAAVALKRPSDAPAGGGR